MYLSHPADLNVNDRIPKELCSLSYTTVDTATHHIKPLGPRMLLAKMDIKMPSACCPCTWLTTTYWNGVKAFT